MIVSAVQYRPIRGELEHNRARLAELAEQAALRESELIVLPEMCTSGYLFENRESIRPYCEKRSGVSVTLFQNLASTLGTTICFGWPEWDSVTDLFYNSAAVCCSDGTTLFYRKNLLFESDETWAESGDTPYPLWRHHDGHLCTLGVCMDLNDDLFIEHLLESEARIIAFPTNWLEQDVAVWDYWAWRLRSTKACLVAGNRFGSEDGTPFCGKSAILDGRTLLAWVDGGGEAIITAHIPLEPTPYACS